MSSTSYKHEFAIVTCARWDHDNIIEWINYHIALGFDHIYLYSNDDDPWSLYEIVKGYTIGKSPCITYRHHPFLGQQRGMYMHFMSNYLAEVDWVMFLDIDEFLYLGDSANLPRFVNRYRKDYDSVYLNWVLFGNNGYIKRHNGPVIESYFRRSASVHTHTKHITRAKCIPTEKILGYELDFYPFWHYWCEIAREKMRVCNVLGTDMAGIGMEDPAATQKYLRSGTVNTEILEAGFICHFIFKSEEDFLRRAARGSAGDFKGMDMWADMYESGKFRDLLAEYNEVEDYRLYRFYQKLYPSDRELSTQLILDGPNLSEDKLATQSSRSIWSSGSSVIDDATNALKGEPTATFRFHTQEESSPWWCLDLGRIFDISCIKIYNRIESLDLLLRSRFLFVFTSEDGTNWRVKFRTSGKPFGGVDGFPLIIEFKPPARARYVKLQLEDHGCLHLNKIEIY